MAINKHNFQTSQPCQGKILLPSSVPVNKFTSTELPLYWREREYLLAQEIKSPWVHYAPINPVGLTTIGRHLYIG